LVAVEMDLDMSSEVAVVDILEEGGGGGGGG